MASFSELNLDPAVQQALDDMGYQQMMPVQEMAIPKLLAPTDFLGQAPTGTGKTAAFGIPLINRIDATSDRIEALILAPTRELAQQISEELSRIGQHKGIKVIPVYGGESVFAQKDELRTKQYQIAVGTPGRVLDHMRQLTLNVTTIRYLVLDEADEMLDMGFLPDIETILKQLPMGRETWLFSATMPPEIQRLANNYLWSPQEVRIQPQVTSAENIKQYYYIVSAEEKPRAIREFLQNQEAPYAIIFCQTKKDVVQLSRRLRERLPLDCLHGAMQQSDRDKVMDEFRNGQLKMLVATDIVARGIDVESLTHVINFDPPADPESYIHRIGRTARKGETGVAITFFTPDQKRYLEQLEHQVGMPLEKHPDSQLEFLPVEPRSRNRNRRSGGRPQRGGHPRPLRKEGEAPRAFSDKEGQQPRPPDQKRNRRRGPRPGQPQSNPPNNAV